MKDNVKRWLAFAEENLACARLVANKGICDNCIAITARVLNRARQLDF